MKKRKTNLERLKEVDNYGDLWNKLGEAKVPRILRPLLILFVEMDKLKDYFSENSRIFTVFGIFAALTIYMGNVGDSKATFFSLILTLLVGVVILFDLFKYRTILEYFTFAIFFMLIVEIVDYTTRTYSDYVSYYTSTIIKYVPIVIFTVLIMVILTIIWAFIVWIIHKKTGKRIDKNFFK